MLRSTLKHVVDAAVAASGRTTLGRRLQARVVEGARQRTQTVSHRGVMLQFAVPNAACKYRADTFSTKEPETLAWIDGLPAGSTLWDIGANVGLYSCYAAKARNCRVFAFEPSVFNLEMLARNIYLNDLAERITIVPLPLSNELAASRLNMSETDWGAALSTFGQSYGHDGRPMRKKFEVPTIGLSMLDAVQLLMIPQPDYIKMDVDGIEHLILQGGMPVLKRVQGISVEINDQFTAQAEQARQCLQEAGLSFKAKQHAARFDTSPGAERFTFNQLWMRDPQT